jgi:hypothetical protein
MSQPLKVAAFQVIISGRFWVITKDFNNLPHFANLSSDERKVSLDGDL